MSDEEDEQEVEPRNYMSSFRELEGYNTIALLNDNSTRHQITKEDQLESFTSGEWYSITRFQGIMINTGVAKWSTARYDQFKALQNIQNTQLDTSRAGLAKIQFGIEETTSIGTINVKTPIGVINFYVVEVNTPFLLCLKDIDQIRV